MDKATRNTIERATQQARMLLDEDFSSQLEGTFDVLRSGVIASQGGTHLSALQQSQRGKIVAAIEHKCSAAMTSVEAVTDYVRDAAFTTLNRFVALKMLEARALVQECITKGEQSAGYREFCGMAPGIALLPDATGYRLYIECLFDEFSTEIKVLFDRRDGASVLWPKRQTFETLLTILNSQELSEVWDADETIGWVYQFFNSGEERRHMRDESQAPRNSRELAVRNQFFTPRYVVQFLTDNTLGRLWLEMHGTETRLNTICEYLARSGGDPLQIRQRKDPRDLRILDPACGSGHFLLYSFDLLLTIYEEAWSSEGDSPRSAATGRTLRDEYPELEDLRRATPELIVEQNLYGVDIDPRCAQIAALALWLRAQRAWKELGVPASERPRIHRTHIVVAEPMPVDGVLVNEFAARLDPPLLRDLFWKMVAENRLAGELGTLLRLEDGIAAELRRARVQFVNQRQTSAFLPGMEPVLRQDVLDLSGIDDDAFFHEAEARIVEALHNFAETAGGGANVRRRLFAGDAAQGVALIDLVRTRFDVMLMNPPFGEMTPRIQEYVDKNYAEARNDIYAVFVRRSVSLITKSNGYVGAITSRAFITGRDHRHFRRSLLNAKEGSLKLFVDLGAGVLDGAMVETAAYILGPRTTSDIAFFDARGAEKAHLLEWLRRTEAIICPSEKFLELPQADLLYDLEDDAFRSLVSGGSRIEPNIGRVTMGLTTKDDFRFVRLRWEIEPSRIGVLGPWVPFAKGGEYSWFTATTHLLVNQSANGNEMAAFADLRDGNVASTRRSSAFYFKPSVCFSRRSQKGFSARRLRPNACFSDKTGVIVPQLSDSPWLYALAPVLASSEYQRLIDARSKFGSYEIGPIKELPSPNELLLEQRPLWERIYSYFDDLEVADETSETFRGVPESPWTPSVGWAGARDALVTGLISCGLTPDEQVLQQIDSWVEQRAVRFDLESSRRSWAVGVAFGRFAPPESEAAPHLPLGFFDAPPAQSPAMSNGNHHTRPILVDDRGHRDDIVDAVLAVLGGDQTSDLRGWLRDYFFSEHLTKYSRSRRAAPVYWQIGVSSRRYSMWLYYLALSRDDLFKIQSEYAGPKLAHEQRQLESLRQELGRSPDPTQRRVLDAQERFVDELRTMLDEVKRVAPLWNPNLDDGVIINFAPLWRLVPDKTWQKELKATWDHLCAAKYDWSSLAMHLWPERVVPKCATNRSLAIAHGVEDVFWIERDDGKWQPRPTPTRLIEELVRERTSIAVKAALKSLLEAPASTANGGRHRGLRAANAVADGGAN